MKFAQKQPVHSGCHYECLKWLRVECRSLRGDENGSASCAPQQGARAVTPPPSQFQSMRHDGSATPPRSSPGGYDEEQAIGGGSRS